MFNNVAWGIIFLIGSIGAIGGSIVGYIVRKKIASIQAGTLENKLDTLAEQAKTKTKEIMLAAKEEAVKILEEAKKQEKVKEDQLTKHEERIVKKEDTIEKKIAQHEHSEKELVEKTEKIKTIEKRVEEIKNEQSVILQNISGYTKDKAKEEIFDIVKNQYQTDILERIRKVEQEGNETLQRKASTLLAAAMQRYSGTHVSEITTTTVSLPSDEMKGKIIGREGRNIRTLERMTGTEIIVDDTPGAIVISCFDPIRRQVCRMALEKLISDGRIQPARIEDAVEKAQKEITKKVKEAGESAVREAGILGIHPQLVALLGRLFYRTSFGQNVLHHSLEAVHIGGMIAQELGADVAVVKMGALLHDIGKAVDHEVQGTHVEIGIKILKKFNIDEKVILAMRSHHEEYPYETLESVIVQIAESISAGRPGARRGTLETYIRRLEELEAIANSFDGVDKAYAISAGREIRVFVTPGKVNDLEAKKLARDIAIKVEKELRYPGEIKVHVIRETRVFEYAK